MSAEVGPNRERLYRDRGELLRSTIAEVFGRWNEDDQQGASDFGNKTVIRLPCLEFSHILSLSSLFLQTGSGRVKEPSAEGQEHAGPAERKFIFFHIVNRIDGLITLCILASNLSSFQRCSLAGIRSIPRSFTRSGTKRSPDKFSGIILTIVRRYSIRNLLTCCTPWSQAERELRVAQSEFDRQSEITKFLLEGVSSSQAGHLRCLHEFVEAQARHYAQCHAAMQDLQRELAG